MLLKNMVILSIAMDFELSVFAKKQPDKIKLQIIQQWKFKFSAYHEGEGEFHNKE